MSAICVLVIGIYAWSARSGIIELQSSGARESYYNLLVQSFRAGQLNLKREVPPELARITDPHDPVLGSSYLWTERYPSVWDLSYYKGKFYLYFGPAPALLLFWPYLALTGHCLLHRDAVVIFLSAGFLASAGLLGAMWRCYFKETSLFAVAAGTFALGLANFAPALLADCDVYEVAISCGYALTMLALAGVWGALHSERHPGRWLMAASLAYGLALGARPSLLGGAVFLLVPVVQAWREKRAVWPLLPAAIGPVGLSGLGWLLYNVLRFGHPLEFGQRFQLPVTVHHQFDLRYFRFNFQMGFLEPGHWSSRFPFVNDVPPTLAPPGYYMVNHPFGVLTNIPLVWLALTVPLAWLNRPEKASSALGWFLTAVVLLFGTTALVLCFHDSMCLRYEFEYVSPLLLLAVAGILALERDLAGQPRQRWIARCVWGLLLVFSVGFNFFSRVDVQTIVCTDLGNTYLHNERFDKAISQYQEALDINPNCAVAWYDLGFISLNRGQVDEAIVQFQKALEIDPEYADAHDNLGTALLQKNKVDEAMAQFQDVLEINPDDAGAHSNLGVAFFQKGSLNEAIAQFQEALRLDPDDSGAQSNLTKLQTMARQRH
ncbi:MAG TPA: tetratricopeptide repeat protein [Candidatus Methylacidiphilales bacterium]|nr:tetratricopeptide repeat protein [Candidatus Methylacidiphilales bacterium]